MSEEMQMLMCPTCRRSQAFTGVHRRSQAFTGVHGRSRAFTGVKNFKNFKVFNYLTTYGYGSKVCKVSRYELYVVM